MFAVSEGLTLVSLIALGFASCVFLGVLFAPVGTNLNVEPLSSGVGLDRSRAFYICGLCNMTHVMVIQQAAKV